MKILAIFVCLFVVVVVASVLLFCVVVVGGGVLDSGWILFSLSDLYT